MTKAMTKVSAPKIGLGCGYSYKCYCCDKETPEFETADARDEYCYREGWVIGLEEDGQAHYACNGCSNGLFGAKRMIPMRLLLSTRS